MQRKPIGKTRKQEKRGGAPEQNAIESEMYEI